MILLKFLFSIVYLISIINLIDSQTICLDNSIITCSCNDGEGVVTCIENHPSNNTFIDWSTFSSDERQRYSFNFINFTRLTSQTFTHFSLTFPLIPKIDFNFTNGIDVIEENIFKSFNYFLDLPIHIRFQSPRNFQLADCAFSQLKYLEFLIDNIQYNDIHHLPYEFNLNAFNQTSIFDIKILNSKEMNFISNKSLSFKWEKVQIVNCSLISVDLLIENLSTFVLDLDFSTNKLIQIPPLIKFSSITDIDLHENFIEQIHSNIFTNLSQVYRIDLSHNRIKHISPGAFIGMHVEILLLNDNLLHSLETVTIHNEVTSFLYSLNETLHTLILSNNILSDFKPIRNLTSLNTLRMCCNQIKHIDEESFQNTHELITIDLSHNHIESIHPHAFKGTILRYLDLTSNPLSTLETTDIVYDEQFRPRNRTTSFLDDITSTIATLSLMNCRNLLEMNWFVFAKLKLLWLLNLSAIPKTDKFWTFQIRNNNASIVKYDRTSKLEIVLNDIRFNDDDYCLSKTILDNFNSTVLIIDQNHSCNCFVFMFKNLFEPAHYPSCLSNQSIVEELTQQCMNIDLYCLSFVNTTTTTTTIPPTESTSLLSSTPILTTELSSTSSIRPTSQSILSSSLSSTSSSIMTSTLTSTMSSTVTSTTRMRESSISSLTTLTITKNILTTLGATKDNGKWKTILAIMIPCVLIVIVLSLTGIYIVNRKKNKPKESIEMDVGFANNFARK
ncbi:unnamed protein product [Adineta ricciae]|uniref:Uncharacterized protein n=1 Tax=Adineta ricciae TaxID=249248 RepID=A0A814BIE5_ADIRI|nr:unnamed protein product [Adineta ricciae]